MGSTIKLAQANDPNRGRSVNFISGIQGIQAGGNGTINMGNDRRFTRLKFQCSAVNYTGGTALATTNIAVTNPAAAGATVTLTASALGIPTAAVAVNTGANYTTGDTITVVDATGTGLVLTVTAAAGAITALALTVLGTPSAMNPVTFFNSFRLSVGGKIIRDIVPDSILKLVVARGQYVRRGELPINFAEVSRDFLQQTGGIDYNDSSAWDMRGEGAFDILFGITAGLNTPTLVGSQEFDTLTNTANVGGKIVGFKNPIWHTEQTVNVPAGRFDVTTLKFSGALQRIWLLGSTAGQLTQLEVYQDNNKRDEVTLEQMLEMYQEFGYNFGQANYINSTWSTSNALKSGYNQPTFFDMAYLPDVDSRFTDRLYFNNLVFRVYSNIAQSVKFVIESAPNSF